MNRILFASLLFVACSTAPAPTPAPAPPETWTKDTAPDTSLVHFDASALTDSGISGQDSGADAAPSPPDASSDAAAALPDASPDAAAAPPDAASDAAAALPDASPDAATAPLDAASDAAAADAAPSCNVPDARGSECGLGTNCGCAEGLVCRVADQHTGQTLCFSPGDRPAYSSCEFDQDCGTSEVCEGGICRAPCETVGTLCSDDAWCGKLTDEGRTVCLGNCNVMPYTVGRWKNAQDWIELQQINVDRERTTLPVKSLDYTPCGDGAYCRPGLASVSPFPYCIPATGIGIEGDSCEINQDCLTGYGCKDNQCRIIAFVDDGCPSGSGSRDGLEPSEWLAPDGYNSLRLCLPE